MKKEVNIIIGVVLVVLVFLISIKSYNNREIDIKLDENIFFINDGYKQIMKMNCKDREDIDVYFDLCNIEKYSSFSYGSLNQNKDGLYCCVENNDNYNENGNYAIIKIFEDNKYEELVELNRDAYFACEYGEYLYYASYKEIYRYHKKDKTIEAIVYGSVNEEHGVSYSEDNNILYVDRGRIKLINKDGNITSLTDGKYPLWYEDNKTFLYAHDKNIYMFDCEDKTSKLIKKNTEPAILPILTQNKKYIITLEESKRFTTLYEQTLYNLYVRPLFGSGKKVIDSLLR